MKKYLFTEEGLQELLETLYALSDKKLQLESDLLRKDPIRWIESHFELDDPQKNFLKKLPFEVIDFLGYQGSFALAHRLPIHLLKEGMKAEGSGDQDKLFKPKTQLSIAADQNGNTVSGGELLLEVAYLLKQ